MVRITATGLYNRRDEGIYLVKVVGSQRVPSFTPSILCENVLRPLDDFQRPGHERAVFEDKRGFNSGVFSISKGRASTSSRNE